MRRIQSDLLTFAGVVLLLLGGTGVASASSPSFGASPSNQDGDSPIAITNEWCPVLTDEQVEPDIFMEYRGERVFLCCQKCLKKFRADPEAYAGNVPALVALDAAQKAGADHEEHGDHEHAESGEDDHDSKALGGHGSDEGHGHDSEEAESHEGGKEHDHSVDHNDAEATGLEALMLWVGRFHPMIVHFPIALLLMAGAAELLLLMTGSKQFSSAARFCLWGGALSALVAAPLGWLGALSVEGDYLGFSAELLFYHRWVGVATATVALMTLFAGERSLRGGPDASKRTYRALLCLSVVLVSVAGHLGASLIYGWEYLSW